MEGITGYLFRNAYQRHFSGIDTHFTPFVTGTHLSRKQKKDICKENNPDKEIVVQILSNQADDFLSVAHIVSKEFGYSHLNLNLGCPSATVTSRKRGAGFLSDPDRLNRFLDEIFSASPVTISVKTRIGMHDASEWENILPIYEKYPLTELIIHPRIRDAFYGGLPDLEAFDYAYKSSRHPLCYNGNIFTKEDYEKIIARFPGVQAIMIGRGLLIDPFLPEEIKGLSGPDVAATADLASEDHLAHRKEDKCLARLKENKSLTRFKESDRLARLKENKNLARFKESNRLAQLKENKSLARFKEGNRLAQLKENKNLTRFRESNRLARLKEFEEDLRESLLTYTEGGPHKVLEKMKEIWSFYCYNFEKPEKLAKKIRKAQTLDAYLAVMRELF